MNKKKLKKECKRLSKLVTDQQKMLMRISDYHVEQAGYIELLKSEVDRLDGDVFTETQIRELIRANNG